MLVRIWPDNPNPKQIAHAAEVLRADGVVVYPTDSVYALGCSLRNPKAVQRLEAIRGKGGNEFSLVFDSLARVAEYVGVDDVQFGVLKRHLPGAFTFLMAPLSRVPDRALAKRRTVGVRIPDNAVARALVEELGCPLLSTSLHGIESDYLADPSSIAQFFGKRVDMVIDGGEGGEVPSTVVDLTGDEPVVVRQGVAEFDF